jgi:hypothetical protein
MPGIICESVQPTTKLHRDLVLIGTCINIPGQGMLNHWLQRLDWNLSYEMGNLWKHQARP